MSLLTVLIFVILVVLAVYVIRQIANPAGRNVAFAVLAVIVLLVILYFAGVLPSSITQPVRMRSAREAAAVAAYVLALLSAARLW
jgi:glucose dehydrogenase